MPLLSKFQLYTVFLAVFLMENGPFSIYDGLREGRYEDRFAKESIEAKGTIHEAEVITRILPRWGSQLSHLLKVQFDVPDGKPVKKSWEVSPGFFASHVKEGVIVDPQVSVRYLAEIPWESARLEKIEPTDNFFSGIFMFVLGGGLLIFTFVLPHLRKSRDRHDPTSGDSRRDGDRANGAG